MIGEYRVKLKELKVELRKLELEYELAKEGLRMSKRYFPMATLSGMIILALAFIAFMTTDREFLTGNQLIVLLSILSVALLVYYSYAFGRIMKVKAKISKTEKKIEIEVGNRAR